MDKRLSIPHGAALRTAPVKVAKQLITAAIENSPGRGYGPVNMNGRMDFYSGHARFNAKHKDRTQWTKLDNS